MHLSFLRICSFSRLYRDRPSAANMVDAAVEVVAAATDTESIAVAAAAEDAIANIDTIVCDEHLRTLMHRGLIGALLAHETNPHNLLSKQTCAFGGGEHVAQNPLMHARALPYGIASS